MRYLSLPVLLSFVTRVWSDSSWPTYISVPSVAEAGVPIQATVNVQWHGLADSSYAYAFRIYLASSYKDTRHYFYDPDCFILKEQSLCDASIKVFSDYIGFYDTPVTVTIPPSVGPSGKHYALIGRIINTDGSYYGGSWESDVFELTGANGTWSKSQRSGYTLWEPDGISCTGFACVKNCADASAQSAVSQNATRQYQDCANACPGVQIEFGNGTVLMGGRPTTALTKPTACPQVQVSRPTVTATTGKPLTAGPTRGSTRTAAASAPTGAALARPRVNIVAFALGLGVVAIFSS